MGRSQLMSELNLAKLNTLAASKIKPFLDEVLSRDKDKIHSIHITGTATNDDFGEKVSDVNSIIVLKEMDLQFLELLAPLGKKYSKQKIAAPLIMTPDYINTSLDVFPVEFLNFKLVHATVLGEDIFESIEIHRMDLRHQCERELKVKLIWLRQGYLSAMGDRNKLTDGFTSSITGYIPLFRGIISLLGKEPPIRQSEVMASLSETTNINTDVFSKILKARREKIKLSIDELNTIFEDYYSATEKIGKIVDEIKD
jgi:hypothetical protein